MRNFWKKLINYLYPDEKTKPNVVWQRRVRMLMQGIASIAITGLGIFFAWLEYGNALFANNLFWILLLVWIFMGMSLFLTRWEEADKKSEIETLSKTINKLITEIREDRKQRNEYNNKKS